MQGPFADARRPVPPGYPEKRYGNHLFRIRGVGSPVNRTAADRGAARHNKWMGIIMNSTYKAGFFGIFVFVQLWDKVQLGRCINLNNYLLVFKLNASQEECWPRWLPPQIRIDLSINTAAGELIVNKFTFNYNLLITNGYSYYLLYVILGPECHELEVIL